MTQVLRIAGVCLMLSLSVACASYYQKNLTFQRHFTSGQMEEAVKDLDKVRKPEKGNVRVLYWLNKGVVHRMLGHYNTSIQYFAKADRYIEDYHKNVGMQLLTYVSNPNITEYRPEDFESVLLHYYQAKNYIDQGDLEGALVEIRRLNIRLNYISDLRKKKITYQTDAFAQVLAGQVYEASGDYNNAFIAYRNAYDTYQNLYKSAYGVSAPNQLKQDIIRTAAKTGLREELSQFEQQFGTTYQPEAEAGKGHLVFYWHNGLGPVKAEWAVSFTMIPGVGGAVTFKNEELGWVFPFPAAEVRQQGNVDLTQTRVVRIALPKYVERKPMFTAASITAGGKQYALEKGEDINAIAFQDLKDRMLREVGQALLRAVIKQTAAELARKKNEGLGVALDILGAVVERADTRNWQTLPHDVFYRRISLPPGEHTISLETTGPRGAKNVQQMQVTIREGRTSFLTFSSLESVTKPLEGIYGE